MIIYKSGLITLDYQPATDILFVEWPDIQYIVLPEIRQALKVLVENIRNYDIKRLLIDSSKTNVEIQDAEYKEILKEFGINIMSSRLQKLARVQTNNENREQSVEEVKNEVKLSVELKTFSTKQAALEWLKA